MTTKELRARAEASIRALRIIHGDKKPTVSELYDAATVLSALLDRVERYEEALEPFARMADKLTAAAGDDQWLSTLGDITICVGDLRAARAALGEEPL